MPSQVSLEKTRSGRFVVLSSDSSETSEVHLLDLHAPHAQLQCMQQRLRPKLYHVS